MKRFRAKDFPLFSLHEARYPAVEIIPGKGVAHTRHIIGRGERRGGGGGRARPVIGGGGGRGKAGTPINANQIESREYEAYSQIKRIKAS